MKRVRQLFVHFPSIISRICFRIPPNPRFISTPKSVVTSLVLNVFFGCLELEKSISFAAQVISFDGVRRMVESGLGIAILPDGVTEDQLGGGR